MHSYFTVYDYYRVHKLSLQLYIMQPFCCIIVSNTYHGRVATQINSCNHLKGQKRGLFVENGQKSQLGVQKHIFTPFHFKFIPDRVIIGQNLVLR